MAVTSCTLSFLLLFLSLEIAKCELFTALIDLEHLIYRERELKSSLKNYIAMEEERLATLKKFSEKVENIHNRIDDKNVELFLGHPVNSYLIIKRFFSEWTKVEELLQKDNSEEIMETIDKHKTAYSSKEDFEGAITALLRLQDTYRLLTKTVAEGKLKNAQPMPAMTVDDCYQIGRYAYLTNDMFSTKVWMEEVLRKLKMNEPSEDITVFDVSDHLAYAEFKRGDIRKALNYTLEMVRLDPRHQRALDNVAFFGKEIKKIKTTGLRGETGRVLPKPKPSPTETFKRTIERDLFQRTKAFQNYEKLCRGEIRNLTKWEKSKMKCWLVNNDPLTILKPARMERVFVHPEIFIIRDVISDSEIEHIKKLAVPRLERATVTLDDGTLETAIYRLRRATIQNPVTGNLEFAKYRISKSGWIKDEEDALVKRISQRVQAITGLYMATAEELQVVNYGIGGHYEPHFDFARDGEDKFTSLGTGNRIATFLAYLSNIQSGGGTVFTRVGTVVWPSKGDAAFWYNLKKNGDGDDSTRHAACPVLVGSKWVANKWIHEVGQEFRRRCSLNRNE